ncbi:Gp49 family protein [Paraburkholderia sp. EB58]|uniref:Gp49 family protein n=1 Tax=Paraburkholderia sp. EB58 TaxID=3035125 RepID=UPI003D24B21E
MEKEIQDKGLNAPRVTPASIDALIIDELYFTAYEASIGQDVSPQERPLVAMQAHGLLTFCVLTLRNGFTVTGESACASPENFNAEIGRKIARENARAKVWPLEGYLLKQRLADAL